MKIVSCSIGSLGQNGKYDQVEEEIHVQNCNFNGTKKGVRIKTWQVTNPSINQNKLSTFLESIKRVTYLNSLGREGLDTPGGISFTGIRVKAVDNPIVIDQYYCPRHKCTDNNIRTTNKCSYLYYKTQFD